MGYQWYPLPGHPGVEVRPMVSFNASGPHTKCIKLAANAELNETVLERDRLVVVMAGGIRFGDTTLSDLHVLFGQSGMTFDRITAEEPTFLVVHEWEPRQQPLASIWRQW
jgi:hypothetical protein